MGLILRIDDVHPNMDINRFLDFIKALKNRGVTAIIGVIPKCEDKSLYRQQNDENEFWKIIRELYVSGWPIAQHGYTHVYDRYAPTRLMGWCKSEFAGHSYEEQYTRLRKGKQILENFDIHTDIFMAPKHSYDQITLSALKNSGFKYLTDGFALAPYSEGDIIHIPQLIARYHQVPGSTTTCCIHLDTMSERKYLDNKVKLSKYNIIDLDKIAISQQVNKYFGIDKKIIFTLFQFKYRIKKNMKQTLKD